MKEPEAGPPSNADRAALAKILTVLVDRENAKPPWTKSGASR